MRFDGIYCCFEGTANYMLRFFADGMVTAYTCFGDEDRGLLSMFEDKDRLMRDRAERKGRYEVDGERIAFSVDTVVGRIDYSGNVYRNGLVLESYSHVNDVRSEDEIYIFYRDSLIASIIAENDE